MDLEQVESILEKFCASELASLELDIDDVHLKVTRPSAHPVSTVQVPAGIPTAAPYAAPAAAAPVPAAAPAAPAEAPAAAAAAEPAENVTLVKAPLVGVFYAAPSPTSDPYVTVGSHVHAGQVLCLVEAMKVMNEIKAPVDGTIVKINVENATTVAFDDVIMEIA